MHAGLADLNQRHELTEAMLLEAERAPKHAGPDPRRSLEIASEGQNTSVTAFATASLDTHQKWGLHATSISLYSIQQGL